MPVFTIKLIEGFEGVLKKGSMLAYIVYMAQRIQEIWRVLKLNGSFYLHCDPTMSHYLKLLLDSVFVARGGKCRNEIVWNKGVRGTEKRNNFQMSYENVFYYSKTDAIIWNQLYEDYSPKSQSRYNKVDAYGKKYALIKRKKANGEIYYGKTYFNEKGKKISNIFVIPTLSATDAERLGYPTQKPEKLLDRIIKASSNEGDTVLDCFCGCGTTVSVCQKLKRKWIGIDINYQAISLIEKRL
jgi:site-specific DNA-methyltransferase (adenine-specific)